MVSVIFNLLLILHREWLVTHVLATHVTVSQCAYVVLN